MRRSSTARVTTFIAVSLALAACGGPTAGQPPIAPGAARVELGGQERVLYSFTGQGDGGDPAADLVFDASGSLVGTTVVGGTAGCGTVFALTPGVKGSWKETARYSFDCYSTGKNPYGGVLFNGSTTAYGTTVSGGSGPSCGSSGCGVAYELSGSSESVLHDFAAGSDGFGPGDALAADANGDLFGMTPDGGKDSAGVVYELTKRGNAWSERVIHAFTGGKDGGTGSLGRLTIDDTGIYGVAETGGAYGAGTVFRMTYARGTGWRFTTLYAFKGVPDCASPYGGLVKDSHGNIYGTTYSGGTDGLGCIFELNASHAKSERVLHNFEGGSDGSRPTGTLFQTGVELYGTTSMGGGSCDCGTVFALDTQTRHVRILHSFHGASDGAYPYYGVTPDSSGNLYGTTAAGGTANRGTVFEIRRPARR